MPAANRCYRQRRFWDELYRQEGAEPREWLGGLSRFLPQLEAELRPGDRILVLGTCPVPGEGWARPPSPTSGCAAAGREGAVRHRDGGGAVSCGGSGAGSARRGGAGITARNPTCGLIRRRD